MDDLERLRGVIRKMNKKMASVIEEDAKMYREFLENEKKKTSSTTVKPKTARHSSQL